MAVVGLGTVVGSARPVDHWGDYTISPPADTEPEPNTTQKAPPLVIPLPPAEGDPEAPPTPSWETTNGGPPDGRTPPLQYMPVAFVADGAGNREIYSMYPDGSGVARLTNHPADDREPDWYGDGSKILFSSNRFDSEGTTDYEVWAMNADGSGQTQLTHNIYNDGEPALSKDGLTVLFTSDRPNGDGKRDKDIWKMNADGTTQRRVTLNREDDHRPVWSPNPNLFVFTWDHWDVTRNKFDYSTLQYVGLDGTGQKELTLPNSIKQKAALPSGGAVHFFFSGGGGGGDIYVKNNYADSGASSYWRLTDHAAEDSEPTTDADAKWIIFHSKRDDAAGNIYRMDRNGRQLVQLTNWPGYEGQPAWCRTAIPPPPVITPSPKMPDPEPAPDPTAAVTLLNLTLDPTTVLGGDPSTGTVTLTGPAPANGLTVALASNSATATVPQTVTVPAGDITAPFPITTTPTTATTVATISAVHGEVTKTADLTVEAPPPPAEAVALQSLSLNRASIVGGRSALGRVTLSGLAPAGGTQVALSSDASSVSVPAVVTVLEGRSSVTFPISTTAVSASATATITAAYAGVTKTATLRVTPRFEITNVNNGDVLKGYVTVSVSVYDGTIGLYDLTLKVGSISLGVGREVPSSNGTPVFTFAIQTEHLSNGSYALAIVDPLGNQDSRSVTLQNDIFNVRYDPIFDVTGSDSQAPTTCRIVAQVEAGLNWTLEVQNTTSQVIKTFNGTGTLLNVTWDGTDNAGAMHKDGNFKLVVKTTPSASSLSATAHRRARHRSIGKGRSRNRMRASSAGVSIMANPSDWGDPSIWFGITNKCRITDTFILLSVDYFAHNNGTKGPYSQGDREYCLEYADFVRAQVDLSLGVKFEQPAQPLIVSKSLLTQELTAPPGQMLPDPYPGQAKRVADIITHRFSHRYKLIYVAAHGGFTNPRPHFFIGEYAWHSGPNPETLSAPDTNFDVSAILPPYGLDDGDYTGPDPPLLVWMDNCNSAGGKAYYPNQNCALPTAGVNTSWAVCFGIDPVSGYDGAFLGWSGFSYLSEQNAAWDWKLWRGDLWRNLFEQGRNFQTAFNRVNSITQMLSPAGNNPQDRARWYGNGYTSFR